VSEKEVKIKLLKMIDSKTPYWQQGSFRMILPRILVRKYGHIGSKQPITRDCGLEDVPFVFIETDKGILIMPLKEALKDPDMMKGLAFAPTSGLSLKEVSKLIHEEAEKE